jgi:hypothetical protein
MSKNKARDAWRLIHAAMSVAKEGRGKDRIEEMDVHTEVDDVDFDSPVVVTGDWNEIDDWDEASRTHILFDATPKRLGKALEKFGIELAWSDCCDSCDNCGKLVNTNPHCYGWQPRYTCSEDGTTCLECLDPEEHLSGLEGDPRRANNVPTIEPVEHGYFLFEEGLEHGWHPGQDASPEVIAKAMRKRGIERFLFHVDDIGQFDMKFSVYIHEDEREKANKVDALTREETDGPSVSEAMKRGLQAATVASSALTGEGVKYVKVEGDTVVEARVIPPQEFAEKGVRR